MPISGAICARVSFARARTSRGGHGRVHDGGAFTLGMGWGLVQGLDQGVSELAHGPSVPARLMAAAVSVTVHRSAGFSSGRAEFA